MASSVISQPMANFKTCNLTGTYISSGSITYCIVGKIMFFYATVKPNQNITSAVGEVTIADDIGTFKDRTTYQVCETGNASNRDAITMPSSKNFRVMGAMSNGANYYFSGIAMLD